LGVGISAITMQHALDQMRCWIEQRQRAYVVVAPVHAVMEAQFHADYRTIVNRADMVTPDGMPLVLLSRWMGQRHVERVYGPDLMLAFSQLAAEHGFSSFFYGGAAGIPAQLADALTQRFPGLQVAGAYSPPYRALTPDEDQAVVDMINAANPDVVWVGLGCPKQDIWMAEHRALLNAPVLVGVGAAFDFIAGQKRQAPRWMMRYSLEWLFRLLQEPHRLWRRYLFYNPLFVLLVFLQVLGVRRIPLAEQENGHPQQ
jgi:N-acetylglucosaminyldiphosphoundecaprenol N-acetyl-beta-D-mannosaminyltransferase